MSSGTTLLVTFLIRAGHRGVHQLDKTEVGTLLRIEIEGTRIRPEIILEGGHHLGRRTARFHRERQPGLCRDGNRTASGLHQSVR
jgi:hypothetical protein